MNTALLRGNPAWCLLLAAALGCAVSGAKPASDGADDGADDASSQDEVDAGADETDAPAIDVARPAAGLAHNIIIFMGDGMGPEQLSTGRYARGGPLHIDGMVGPAFANTDSLTTIEASDPDLCPTDSAAAATVIATGERVDNGVLSVDRSGAPLETVLELCQRAGKATGLVTTSYFFDASPSAFAVHQGSRSYYDAIVRQMLTETRPDLIMGAGSEVFDTAGNGLLEDARANGYAFLRGATELMAWDPEAEPRVIGLFETDFVPVALVGERYTMTPALERRPDSPDPTLAMMTARALDRLGANADGFFLFAEDELTDEMGHNGPAEVAWVNRAYPEQVAALDDAVGVAIDWVQSHSSFEETLIVVLADHETGGYHYDHERGPTSGNFSAFSEGELYRAGNHTRAPTAVYALGPGSAAIRKVHAHADTHQLLLGELR